MTVLLDNQINAISKLEKYKVGALFMDTGTGKTRTMIELVNSVKDIDKIFYFAPFSAINPPSGVSSIIDEVNKWGGFKQSVSYFGVESIGLSDRIYMNILDEISNCYNPFIIIDESIKIKNFSAKRTKRLLKISELAEYKLIANATYVTRDLLDVWAQMQFLSPKILNMSLPQFESTFCEKTKVIKIHKNSRREKEFISGYGNIDYLYDLIGHYIYECDLDVDVEEKSIQIKYELEASVKDRYYEIKNHFLSDEMLFWRNNDIFMQMTQKMQRAYALSDSKIDNLNEHFKEFDKSRSVIYCKYIDSQILCKKLYPKALVLSYQKNALSLNLQYDYDNLIFFDKIWDYYLVKQAKGRIRRTGRQKPINYISITGNVGLEKLIDDNISKKISMVDYFKKVSVEQLNSEL